LALGSTAPALAADTPGAKTLYKNGPSGRYLLDGTWYERPDPTDQGIKQGFQQSSSLAGWGKTRVPDAANAGDFSPDSFIGRVHWYRKDFKAPRASSAAKWILRFESVNYRAKVWLNGKPIGFHVGSYIPFELRAKSIKRGGVNRLVVRADGRRQKFDIPPISVTESGAFEGGWWNYTGILREVYLRKVTNLELIGVFVKPRLRGRGAARINVEATVENVTGHGRRPRLSGSIGGRPLRRLDHVHRRPDLRVPAPEIDERLPLAPRLLRDAREQRGEVLLRKPLEPPGSRTDHARGARSRLPFAVPVRTRIMPRAT
jgi:beta-glucuronidase